MPSIADFIKKLDNPKAPIAYPKMTLYESTSGDKVIRLKPDVQERVRRGQKIVGPLQVIRRPGLGDKVFALAACSTFTKQYPEVELTFSGMETDTWLPKVIDWLPIGLNPHCNTVANLDNTPCNGGDRAKLMGDILGVDVTTIEFPIKIPRKQHNIPKPYYVFVPFAAMAGPRSLPIVTIKELLSYIPLRVALTDAKKYDFANLSSNVVNCTGMDMMGLIALIADSAGVIAVDTGVPWLAAAMGKPSLIMFSHIRSAERTMTCHNVWGVEPQVLCAKSCGDHIGTRPQCRWKESVPVCMAGYSPSFVRYLMREFERMAK